MLGCITSVALLMPTVGNAQVYEVRSSPEVSAAASDWQVNSQLIPIDGLVYAPTRESRMFDPQVMVQIAVYQGVSIFADATMQPWSVVYVPVGSGRMRTYYHVTGNESGLLPVTGVSVATPDVISEAPPAPVMTTVAPAVDATVVPPVVTRATYRPTRIESIPAPHGKTGVWVEFRGARWYSNGEAVTYSADRFARIGEYRGFPVYRDRTSKRDLIWVSVVKDGPVAPYSPR
jgi:hypothetical protein